jgi:hypothetical protein
MSEGES